MALTDFLALSPKSPRSARVLRHLLGRKPWPLMGTGANVSVAVESESVRVFKRIGQRGRLELTNVTPHDM